MPRKNQLKPQAEMKENILACALSDGDLFKFRCLMAHLRITKSNLLRNMVQDAILQWELKNGRIPVPEGLKNEIILKRMADRDREAEADSKRKLRDSGGQ